MIAPGLILLISCLSFAAATGAAMMLQFMSKPPRASFPLLIFGLIAGSLMVGVLVVQSRMAPTSMSVLWL